MPHPAPTASDNGLDAALIARSLSDPAAFAGVFDRHWTPIHRYCTSRAGPAGEDLAAETFRVAFDERARFDPAYGDAGPWLYGVATNLVRQHFRRAERAGRAHRSAGAAVEPDPADDALGRVEAERLGPALAAALGTIGAAERDALLLHAWAGLGYAEIAAATGVPIGTVRSRLHRARAGLRAHLDLPTGDDR